MIIIINLRAWGRQLKVAHVTPDSMDELIESKESLRK